jgi:hypothetical protein
MVFDDYHNPATLFLFDCFISNALKITLNHLRHSCVPIMADLVMPQLLFKKIATVG